MHILRDSSSTYEIGRSADLRRPGLGLPTSVDRHSLARLIRSLCVEPDNVRVLAGLVEAETGRRTEGAVLCELAADLVACGRLIMRERSIPDAYPLPDPYAEPPMPLAELSWEEPEEHEPIVEPTPASDAEHDDPSPMFSFVVVEDDDALVRGRYTLVAAGAEHVGELDGTRRHDVASDDPDLHVHEVVLPFEPTAPALAA